MTRIRNDKYTIPFCYDLKNTLFLQKHSMVFVPFVLVFVCLGFQEDLVVDLDLSKNSHLKASH